MGRWKAEATIVRELDSGLTIIFNDRESIYVYDERGDGHIFHRWYAPRGSYGDYWRDFRRKMLRNKFTNILQIYELAARFNVLASHTRRKLDLSKRKVDFRK